MSNFPKCNVLFRLFDDKLEPLEITKMLCIEPDISHKKGDPNTRITKKGKVMEFSPHSVGMWGIYAKKEEGALLEEHIKSLLILLEPVKDKIAVLFSQGYKMDLFCGLFAQGCPQPGVGIDSSVLKRVGELNISIEMCFY